MNGFRAVPFIVLLVALIPFTRLVVGTTIGVWAAIVPLAVSARRSSPGSRRSRCARSIRG